MEDNKITIPYEEFKSLLNDSYRLKEIKNDFMYHLSTSRLSSYDNHLAFDETNFNVEYFYKKYFYFNYCERLNYLNAKKSQEENKDE